ncbi:MAG TPA: sulfur carrier protein ThiS [Thermomicrobiales bacterium]|nr:sulfur carrier protein ThiS [Thermomicrobiales bacterium]
MAQTSMATITVQLNGIDVTVPHGMTLGGLIDNRGIERRMIAVEYNAEILPRHAYDATILNDGDRLEVVQMVGGG